MATVTVGVLNVWTKFFQGEMRLDYPYAVGESLLELLGGSESASGLEAD